MGSEASSAEESFGALVGPEVRGSTSALVEYPHYTRPAKFREWEVPEVLRSGDHARIARWRRAQSLRRTLERRPDLVGRSLTADEERLLAEFPASEAGR